jgi:hypothetical protein
MNGATLLRLWKLVAPKEDKPHGYRYSLAYIVGGERVIAMTKEKARETTGTTAGRRKPTVSKALTNFLMISLRT